MKTIQLCWLRFVYAHQCMYAVFKSAYQQGLLVFVLTHPSAIGESWYHEFKKCL